MQACGPKHSLQLTREAPPLRTLLDFAAWLLVTGRQPCGISSCAAADLELGLVERGTRGYLEAELPALAEATRVLQVLCGRCPASSHCP